jgi:cyclic beta-1,2-glucan synthetase
LEQQHAGGQQHTHFDFVASAAESERALPETPEVSDGVLRDRAAVLVAGWEMTVPTTPKTAMPQRIQTLETRLKSVLEQARKRTAGNAPSPELDLLRSRRMLEQVIAGSREEAKQLAKLPHVHIARTGVLPRIANLAEDYCAAVGGIWSEASTATYLRAVQERQALLMREVEMLPQALKFAALEFILDQAEQGFGSSGEALAAIPAALHSLVRLGQYEWGPLLESLVVFDPILRQDPSGTYAAMEAETRAAYRRQVAQLAGHADFNELETATAALEMARQGDRSGDPDVRRARRVQHIGFYLLAEGLPELKFRIGYHAGPEERALDFVRTHNDDFYLIGIILLTVLLIVPITAPLVPHHAYWLVMMTLLLALLPVTQGAIDLVNGFVTSLLKAEALPKIDYSKGVPAEATTLVVVPTLLLRESQVQELFEDLEARYLSNEDPNIHFALLTDLPDTPVQPPPDEGHPLVQMAMRYTENLNAKYANGRGGKFFLLHRHRVFNHRQGVWMGWERKRGKLLDLNKLLLHLYDSFPIKIGPVHLLDRVCYVITLDSDTMLPHTAARRMIGTMHHPLNRAIVSPKSGIVTVGYGILQPRVGVSVASASRSRLAAIYSGETGFDIYTRAVSDVYQDLFGEGIFTGKGIYEVSILNRVLEKRFPRNSLLSHDLIEGAYVRAGLVTDVEVIDDYPSQYHAHTRRQHRWIRGDWQILRWLFSPVPDESGKLAPNPISLISKWKILDNLRRSLVEPVTFLILVFGWFFLPGGAVYWTLITIALLLLPATVQLGFDLLRALSEASLTTLREALETFTSSMGLALIHLTFLPHQMMMSIDAIVRSINRTFFSGRHLLEWETAAQAESSSGRKTSLDIYLQLSPVVAILLAAGLALHDWHALYAAGPVLVLWVIAPFLASWLNSSPRRSVGDLKLEDRAFLEDQALRLWRFYADYAGEENHWLVPDHVEEKDFHQVRLLTPTNIGMLLNGRLAAYELSFLTLPEFARATLGSLASYEKLEKYRGHVFNWYDLVTLRPIQPVVVSTVDSGNLAAAFYTLRAGALDLMRRPLVCAESFAAAERIGRADVSSGPRALREWVRETVDEPVTTPPGTPHDRWAREEAGRRRAALAALVAEYAPWLLPEFAGLAEIVPEEAPTCIQAEEFLRGLMDALGKVATDSPLRESADALQARLPDVLDRTRQLYRDLQTISDLAERFVEEMDFGFLFVESRQLLSNGFDMAEKQLHKPCFDLLASEARTAAFLAVAKGEIPQRSWFRLDRSHTLFKGQAVLLSWTATMFEHLMPTLWMRSYPDTLLTNSLTTVIKVQMDWVRGMPWGISESGYAQTDENGRYFYQAWGIPSIALKYHAEDGPVISPYSTFLALPLMRREALDNLRRMQGMGWVGEYGFYEAADYIQTNARDREPRLVRSWMAHHQGMSLLAVTNVLRANIFQTWFHANPRVRAAEQLLHEKPLSKEMVNRLEKEAVAEPRKAAA